MPVYKDKTTNTWYASFHYKDWTGQSKRKLKRGFRTKKEAQKFEAEYKRMACADMDMTLQTFVDVYFNDKQGELKQKSIMIKRQMIDAHIIPYFGDKKMNEITPADIIQWQQVILKKGFKPTYERMVQNQITALFTHASKIYNLSNNPCSKVKKIGKSDASKLEFWTLDEYEKFISHVEKGTENYIIFEILFWTGCREGELLALTPKDFDFQNNLLHINKTYSRIEGKDVIDTPKTESSVRTIKMPKFLSMEIKEYLDKHYQIPDDIRIFPIVPRTLQKRMKVLMEKADVKKIRVHDLRHSHVAYLIYKKVQPLIIKERLGHRDIKITLNTYGHLYPSQQEQVADILDEERTFLQIKNPPVSANTRGEVYDNTPLSKGIVSCEMKKNKVKYRDRDER